MNMMKEFVKEKTSRLKEDFFAIDDDLGGRMKIAATPIRSSEVKKLISLGQGLRIIVGADDLNDLLVVWAGDSDSNIGAMHDTVADQFGMNLHYDKHVPLEMTSGGKLRITTTAQAQFDNAREVENVLDRNKEYQKIFGQKPVDMSKLDAW